MTTIYYFITTILCGSITFFSCRQEATNIRNERFNEPGISNSSDILIERFLCPTGYTRKLIAKKTFADWLENTPLRTSKTPVYLYNNTLKSNQSLHAAVLDFDRGSNDLQQCADAVIRLRAEYLFQKQAYDSIVFTFTNGTKASYSKWREGYRPVISGNAVSWTKSKSKDTSYACFRSYLNTIFMYCGTYSLSKELKQANISTIQGGDVFIYGGFPGHAMIVIDVAINNKTGKKIFMLAQSYMPAQDIHIVKNISNNELSPWYEIPENGTLETPEWTFDVSDLKRF